MQTDGANYVLKRLTPQRPGLPTSLAPKDQSLVHGGKTREYARRIAQASGYVVDAASDTKLDIAALQATARRPLN